MIKKETVALLICPKCKAGGLEYKGEENKAGEIIDGVLKCNTCNKGYPVSNGVPDMIITGDNYQWKEWKDKIDIFDNQVAKFKDDSFRTKRLMNEWNTLKAKFFDFCNLSGSMTLDIGCGYGGMREFIKEGYYGMDPIIRMERYSYPFIRSIGEYIPFKGNMFDNIIILGVMDHTLDPILVLKEAKRVLKRRGHIYIGSKVEFEGSSFDKLSYYLKTFLKKLSCGDISGLMHGLGIVMLKKDDSHHLHQFSSDGFKMLLSRHFKNVESETHPGGLLVKGEKE